MTIVEINGGLGNQIMQYIFSRYIEIVDGKTNVIHDTMFYFSTFCHTGFELENLFKNAKLNIIVDKFDTDVMANIVKIYKDSNYKKTLPNILAENDVEISAVIDRYWHDNNKLRKGVVMKCKFYLINEFRLPDPEFPLHEMLKDEKNLYYMGIWFNECFGNAIKKEIEHELQFPELEHQENIDYHDQILNSDTAVGLHVRRGDFIECKKDISDDKYSSKIRDLKRNLAKTNSPKPNFFIFSDDLDWCKENITKLGFNDKDNITFIEGNEEPVRNYIDMQLLTYCDYIIHNGASSFGFSAQMISPKPIIRIPC